MNPHFWIKLPGKNKNFGTGQKACAESFGFSIRTHADSILSKKGEKS